MTTKERKQAKILRPFAPLNKSKRYKVFFGGRSSGKSFQMALTLLIKGSKKPLRIMCLREIQNSITDSIHKLLSDLNDEYGLGYNVQNTSITHPCGTEIIFAGLKTNISKIKSTEGIDIAFCEEAQNISDESWEILIPTIRKDDSEIWICFNPFSDQDATWERFVKPYLTDVLKNKFYEDDEIYVRRINYDENGFNSQVIKNEIQKLKESDYERYKHIYLGEPIGAHENILIKPKWFDAAIDSYKKLGIERFGARIAGLDVSDGGKDHSALVSRFGCSITDAIFYKGTSLPEACQKAQDHCSVHNIHDIVYDATGMGVGARVYFDKIDPQNVIGKTGFMAGKNSNEELYKKTRRNKDMFVNQRAEWYWKLRDRFLNTYNAVVQGQYIDPDEMIDIPADLNELEVLKHELCSIEFEDRNGRILIQSKQSMTKSPDLADALMYAFCPVNSLGKVKTVHLDFGGWDG